MTTALVFLAAKLYSISCVMRSFVHHLQPLLQLCSQSPSQVLLFRAMNFSNHVYFIPNNTRVLYTFCIVLSAYWIFNRYHWLWKQTSTYTCTVGLSKWTCWKVLCRLPLVCLRSSAVINAVYTIQPVVKPVVKRVWQPVWQQVVSCKRAYRILTG